MNWYYDSTFDAYEGNRGLVDFCRVYCIDFNLFGQHSWHELERIYASLPGSRYTKDVFYWYGDDDEKPPWLSVSVEPTGLQVDGVLPLDDWSEWNTAFIMQVEASSLPIYEP